MLIDSFTPRFLDSFVNSEYFTQLAVSIADYARLSGKERAFLLYKSFGKDITLLPKIDGEPLFYEGNEKRVEIDGIPIALTGSPQGDIEYPFS